MLVFEQGLKRLSARLNAGYAELTTGIIILPALDILQMCR